MNQTYSTLAFKSLHTAESDTDAAQEGDEGTEISPANLERLVQEGIVSSHPRIVHGAYVFVGTRVPLYNLWDYLAAGDSVEDFMESFPTIPRTLIEKAIEVVGRPVSGGASHS